MRNTSDSNNRDDNDNKNKGNPQHLIQVIISTCKHTTITMGPENKLNGNVVDINKGV